jgi:peptidoglycan hydrolase-like amidase
MHTTARLLLPALALTLLLPATATAQEGFDVRDDVAATPDTAPDLRFDGGGWGHGVGMSQYGAYAMALDGRSVEEILNAYYEGTHLAETSDLEEVPAIDDRRVHVGLQEDVESAVIEVEGDEVPWQACDDDGCVPFDDQPEGVWRVVVDEQGLVVEVRDDDGSFEPREALDATELRVTPGLDAPIEVEVARADGSTVDRTMARGTHRILDVTDRAADDVVPALTTVQVLDDVETYLYGLAEMPSSWGLGGGEAALEAQAVAGRTYAADRLEASPAAADCRCHLRADASDQVYAGHDKEGEAAVGELWVAAVDATDGRLLARGQELAQALYSSSHNERSEHVEDSWAFPGAEPHEYLRSVDDPYSSRSGLGNRYTSWSATVDHEALVEHLAAGVDPDLVVVEQLRIGSRTEGGTPRELAVDGRDADGTPVSAVYTGPDDGITDIALAALRRDLEDVEVVDAAGEAADLDTLPSSQVDAIAFATFVDDDGRVHEHAAAWSAAAGIAEGVATDRFAPTRKVTRGQMAAFVHRTFDVPASDEQHFEDVGPDHVHAEAIDALAAAGVAQGRDGERFAPGASVTRQQLASFLARTMGLEEVDDDNRFDDLVGGVHDGNVRALAAAGITEGCAEERFCPRRTVPREQVAALLHRAVRS